MAIIEKAGGPATPTRPEDDTDGRMWTNRRQHGNTHLV